MEVALYHPQFGYYAQRGQRIGKAGDFVTSPSLSPVFSFALSRVIREFLSRVPDGLTSIVDMGCGDGSLIHSLYVEGGQYFGVDRFPAPGFASDLATIAPNDAQLVICNELFDALPFTRLVQRDEHLHELWVTDRDGELDWREHEAEARYDDYFSERKIELSDGQFADV